MDWQPHGNSIDISVYVVVKTRKTHDRWEFVEVLSGQGDWSDLVHDLYVDFEQFKQDISTAGSTKNKYQVIDRIADKLSKQDQPYEFKLPDGTDEWYYALCKPVRFKLNHEGKLT